MSRTYITRRRRVCLILEFQKKRTKSYMSGRDAAEDCKLKPISFMSDLKMDT